MIFTASPRVKNLSFTALAVILLIAWGFPGRANSEDPASDSANTFQGLEAQAEARPNDITDERIAWFLSLGVTPVNQEHGSQLPGLIMWQGRMRVAIEDSHGHDLSLSTYPGYVIKSYLTSLADYVGLPVTITSVAAHDNNLSVVVSQDKKFGDAGTIYGVPELTSRPHELMSQLLPPTYSLGIESGALDLSVAQYMSGYTEKACVLNLVMPKGSPPNIVFVWRGMLALSHFCLGPGGIVLRGPNGRLREEFEESQHPFYFWKIYYHSGLVPGLDQPTAEKKVIQYLNHQKP